MKKDTLTKRLAEIAAEAEREHFDILAATVDTVQAQDATDGAREIVAASEDALAERLIAHAPRIAAVLANAPRGAQAALADKVSQATGKSKNTATKAIGRLRDTGLLMVAHKDAPVLALNSFANRATKDEMAAALEGTLNPVTEKAKGQKKGGEKTPAEKAQAMADSLTAMAQKAAKAQDRATLVALQRIAAECANGMVSMIRALDEIAAEADAEADAEEDAA